VLNPKDGRTICLSDLGSHRSGRSDAFTKVSEHVATLIGAREGAAVIPLRG